MATLTREHVQSVERKLQGFATNLPEQERNVLGWLVARARTASEASLHGEDLDGTPDRGDLATALGFTDEIGDLTISWSKSFEPE